jgi:hypothetical protein
MLHMLYTCRTILVSIPSFTNTFIVLAQYPLSFYVLFQKDVDECSSLPCENGARCIDKVNDYECICKAGYTDKNCSTGI